MGWNVTRLLSQVYKFNVPTFGKDVVFDVSHKVRAEQFKMFSEALKIAKMTDYVPLFVKEAEVGFLSSLNSYAQLPMLVCLNLLNYLLAALCRVKGFSTDVLAL